MANRVMHFEIHATNCEEVAEFYRKVFGWRIHKYSDNPEYWTINTASSCACEAGINGGIFKRIGDKPSSGAPMNGYVCTITVDSIDQYIYSVLTNGGDIVVPKKAIPKLAWVVYCKDVDGNIFGIYEADTNAQ